MGIAPIGFKTSPMMVRFEGDSSNHFIQILEEWNTLLEHNAPSP